MATAASSPVDRLLARYPPDVQALANSARRLVLRLLPRAAETVDLSSGIVAYSYGLGYKGMVCTLIISKAGVKIGLVRGSELDDPHGLLEGRGKVHRHLAVRCPADLRRPGVSALITASHAAWKRRTAAASASA